jgi:hypothetical protein
MNKFGNSQVGKFLGELQKISLDDPKNTHAMRSKFNFSYFDVQAASQDFPDWTHDQILKLLGKLRQYSSESLDHWMRQPIGGSGSVLAVYREFPKRSDFHVPKHVPHQAWWGRFRLESAVRLVGFVVPDEYGGRIHQGTKELFDRNTFYVVYLDRDHRFYKTEKR